MNNTELLNKLDTEVVECLKKLVSSENEVEKIDQLEKFVELFGITPYELEYISYALGMIEAFEEELSENATTTKTKENLIKSIKELLETPCYDEESEITEEAFKEVGIKWIGYE